MSDYGTISPVITINGVDVTAYVVPESLSIESALTQRVDTCSFDLENAAAVTIRDWYEVVVTDGATKLFGGFLQMSAEVNAAGGTRKDVKPVRAADYACLLDHIYVKYQFSTATTDAAMIAALFAQYAPGFDVATYVTAIKTYPRARFNRISLREALDMLAQYSHGDWYVDYDEKLHFFVSTSEVEAAPFSLSDTPNMSTSFGYDALQVDKDGTGVINRVEVVGGTYLSVDTDFYLAGTGKDARVIMPFKMTAPVGYTAIRVWRNDGSESSPTWTAMTVKVGNIEKLTGAGQVLHYYQEKVLEQQSAWTNLPNAIKVTARYDVPLRSRIADAASYAFYGMYLDGILSDPEIVDKTVATLAAQSLMARQSMATRTVRLATYKNGLRAGQTLTLTCARLGITAEKFLIQKVTTRLIGPGGHASYDVECGLFSQDLIDIIIDIAGEINPPPIWQDGETMDEILVVDEGIGTALFTEVTSVSAYEGPYLWDDGTLWGEGAWA